MRNLSQSTCAAIARSLWSRFFILVVSHLRIEDPSDISPLGYKPSWIWAPLDKSPSKTAYPKAFHKLYKFRAYKRHFTLWDNGENQSWLLIFKILPASLSIWVPLQSFPCPGLQFSMFGCHSYTKIKYMIIFVFFKKMLSFVLISKIFSTLTDSLEDLQQS